MLLFQYMCSDVSHLVQLCLKLDVKIIQNSLDYHLAFLVAL